MKFNSVTISSVSVYGEKVGMNFAQVSCRAKAANMRTETRQNGHALNVEELNRIYTKASTRQKATQNERTNVGRSYRQDL